MDQWRNVKGIENPADIDTSGMPIESLKDFGWLNGPARLQMNKISQSRGANWTKMKLSNLPIL